MVLSTKEVTRIAKKAVKHPPPTLGEALEFLRWASDYYTNPSDPRVFYVGDTAQDMGLVITLCYHGLVEMNPCSRLQFRVTLEGMDFLHFWRGV